MATFSTQPQNNQILFLVSVSWKNNEGIQIQSATALFDTGAQMTMITENIVNILELTPVGDVDIVPASGALIKTEKYKIRLDIPITQNIKLPDGKLSSENHSVGDDIYVGKLPYTPANYDVIIGMDFIRLFHITLILK